MKELLSKTSENPWRMKFSLEKPLEYVVSIGQYVIDTQRQTLHDDSHLDNLRDALNKAHNLIRRSECWCLTNKHIDKLFFHLKDACYEAESIVDELEYQCLKWKVQKSWPGEFLTDYIKNWMSGLPGRIKHVQENLYKYCDKMESECNILQIPNKHNEFSNTARPTTTRFGNAFYLCGRDKELENIIRLLGGCSSKYGPGSRRRTKKQIMSVSETGESNVNNKGNVTIMSIVGSGGVGKTTLAQMVFNDIRVECLFDRLIWICISENFCVKRITKDIIECATQKRHDDINLYSLQLTLNSVLASNRFLLVLDDAWSDEERDWQCLLGPMRGGIEGSVILVTTRSHKVVEVASKGMNSTAPVYLEGLEENIYWELFKNCAFGLGERTNSYPELEKIGKEISVELKGSPLAAKTIGNLLKRNLDVSHWSRIRDCIRDHKMWQLVQGEHDILPVLQLSYQYLPSPLKRCFSFCALYPKNFEFTKEELSKFWIMHGFIDCQGDLGEVYFNELVNRCFFHKRPGSHFDEYVIDYLMHDVCQSITKDECFCIENKNFEEKISPNIRHLSVFKRLNRDKELELCKYEKLISLRVEYSVLPSVIETWCNKLTNIRSLSLARCNIKLTESIGNLRHLQHLDFSFSRIYKLPDSFCSLYNLKYLNMEETRWYCSFPERSDRLINLQIFCFPSEGMPLGGSVMNLAKTIVAKNLIHTLTYEGGVKIENLKYVSIHGSLAINGLDAVFSKESAKGAELNKKPLIDELYLNWSQKPSEINEHTEEVLEGLCPHPNLKRLRIFNYGGKMLSPSWFQGEFLPNLAELTIYNCKNDFISHLPRCISKLVIYSCYKLKDLENCLRPAYLPVLKYLEVQNCNELMSMAVESFGEFEFLEQLIISNCPMLYCSQTMVLPSFVKELHLGSCGDLENSIPSCLRELTWLQKLSIRKLEHLVSIQPEVTSNLKSLLFLEVKGCENLKSMGGLQFLASLKELVIVGCPMLEETAGQDVIGKLPSELLPNLPPASGKRRRKVRSDDDAQLDTTIKKHT